MKIQTLISVAVLSTVLSGCGSDGIRLAPTNISTGGSGGSNDGGSSDYTGPCASYKTTAGQLRHGSFDENSGNCEYLSTFVGEQNPLTVDLSIPALANNGVHIFYDSLFVGADVDANAAAQGRSVPQDGEGPQLNIAAGARIAFSAAEDYVRVARGSRINALGQANAPIIFSGIKDLIHGTATESDRGLWGGIQINGNGLTNKCTDAERSNNNCHVTAEGKPATYGGNNNSESSGTLRYVQIRHAGYEVVDGDELNALTLNAVGSGTTIEYVQTYTTMDDAFEMFGGAVDLKYIVAVNTGDDAIDYSEGYVGNIQYALVVNTSGSNTCIEGDNTGSSIPDDVAPYSKLRISNMTCISSGVDANAGAHPSSKGDSEGPLFREGVFFELYNSIITSNATGMESNECMEVVSPQTVASVEVHGYSVAESNVLACTEALKSNPADSATFDIRAWWTASNVLVDDPADLPAIVIDGLENNPSAYISASNMEDANGLAINVLPYDVSTLLDQFDAQAEPAVGSSGSSSFFDQVDFIGAVKAGEDWVSGWTTGL